MSSYAALSAQIDDAESHEAKRRRLEIENSMRTLNSRPAPFQPVAHSELARRAIIRFAERGVRLSAGPDGSLLVSPAGQLDGMEREFLQRHKPEILALLSSHEVL
jgi:hypothetical protein